MTQTFLQISAKLLLLTLGLRLMMPMVLEAHYAWKKQVYMAYCENKLRPQLKCDGKCAVAKMLKKTAADLMPIKPNANVGQKWEEMLGNVLSFQISASVFQTKYTTFIAILHPQNNSVDIFHPPQLG